MNTPTTPPVAALPTARPPIATLPVAARALAVVGWTAESADAVEAFRAAGTFLPVGIADASGTALVRARQDTGLTCHQQVRQFLATAEYDAVLLGVPSSDLVSLIAGRGADLLVLAGAADADTLEAAAEAARTHGVRLAVVRPEAHDAGIGDLVRLVESEDDWRPRYLEVTVEGPAEVERLAGAAISHALRLVPAAHGLVRASAWTGDTSTFLRSVRASLDADDVQLHLSARHAPRSFVRIVGDADAGAFELQISDADATISYTSRSGERIQYPPEWRDHWTVEAHRVAFVDDSARAREEAALLSAIARSATSGEPQDTNCCARPQLRLIEGRGESRPSRGNLRLVVS